MPVSVSFDTQSVKWTVAELISSILPLEIPYVHKTHEFYAC